MMAAVVGSCGTRSRKPGGTARAGNHRFWLLSTLRTHTKAPYKTNLHRKTLRALNRPLAAQTVRAAHRAGPPLRGVDGGL
jgi:hypothetical protein